MNKALVLKYKSLDLLLLFIKKKFFVIKLWRTRSFKKINKFLFYSFCRKMYVHTGGHLSRTVQFENMKQFTQFLFCCVLEKNYPLKWRDLVYNVYVY